MNDIDLSFNNDQRFRDGGNQNYKIEKVWAEHKEIARLIALGKKNTEVAAEVGCTPQTVSNVRNNPIVKAIIDTLSNGRDHAVTQIISEVQDVAPAAIALMKKAIANDYGEGTQAKKDDKTGAELSGKPSVDAQLRAAATIVDKSLIAAGKANGNILINKGTIVNDNRTMDNTHIDSIKKKALELQKQRGIIFTEAKETVTEEVTNETT